MRSINSTRVSALSNELLIRQLVAEIEKRLPAGAAFVLVTADFGIATNLDAEQRKMLLQEGLDACQ